MCKQRLKEIKTKASVEEKERKEVFSNFWEKLSWDQYKLYTTSLVSKSEKTRKKPEEESRRNYSYTY